MSIGFDPSIITPPAVVFPVRRVTVEEYHRLAEVGILTEDDRVELLEGLISPKFVHNPPHDVAVQLADNAIRSRLPAGWCIRVQSAMTTHDSEPEPDLAVVQGAPRDYMARHPGPGDIGLLIEVADSSLSRDRDKRRIYARAGISVYWVINLVDSSVEVYSQPSSAGDELAYAQTARYVAGDEVPLVIAGKKRSPVPVADLLP